MGKICHTVANTTFGTKKSVYVHLSQNFTFSLPIFFLFQETEKIVDFVFSDALMRCDAVTLHPPKFTRSLAAREVADRSFRRFDTNFFSV